MKFNDPTWCMNHKDTVAIMAVVCNSVLLTKAKKRENIGNAIGVDVDLSITKVCHLSHRHRTLVAIDLDWLGCWANILNMFWVGEKIHRGLAVQKDKIRINQATIRRRYICCLGGVSSISCLSKDNHTRFVASLRCIINICHSMNLSQWGCLRFKFGTNIRSMSKSTAIATTNISNPFWTFGWLGALGWAFLGVSRVVGGWFVFSQASLCKDESLVKCGIRGLSHGSSTRCARRSTPGLKCHSSDSGEWGMGWLIWGSNPLRSHIGSWGQCGEGQTYLYWHR